MMFVPASAHVDATSAMAAQEARRQAGDARLAAQLLQGDVERLLMITEALWTLMKKEHGYTDADLIRLIAQIDARDGRIDGKVAATPPAPCASCGRIPAKHRPTCIYCGKPLIAPPFDR